MVHSPTPHSDDETLKRDRAIGSFSSSGGVIGSAPGITSGSKGAGLIVKIGWCGASSTGGNSPTRGSMATGESPPIAKGEGIPPTRTGSQG
jgi:hypothetical protein